MNIIETHNLTKRYRDFTAVNKLNMHVKKGQVYGFLGPNGAGKSTTMKMFWAYPSFQRGFPDQRPFLSQRPDGDPEADGSLY